MLARLGYDDRAWLATTMLAWVVLPASYPLSDPEQHINWAFGIGHPPRRRLPARVHLLVLTLGSAPRLRAHACRAADALQTRRTPGAAQAVAESGSCMQRCRTDQLEES